MALAVGVDNIGDFCSESPWIDYFGPPPPETFIALQADPRIKAIIPLDGSNQVMKFYELARVKIPAMGIGEEWTTLAVDPLFPGWESWQARQHAAFQGHPNYRIDVAFAYHMTFTNMCQSAHVLHNKGLLSDAEYGDWLAWGCDPAVSTEEVNRLAAKYAVAFLKTNLTGEKGYQDILTPGYALTREPLTEFFVTEKRNPNAVDDDWPGAYLYFMHQPGSEQARAEKDPKGMFPIKHPRIKR
jgi:hypothetical protein